jgi:hypothetical protein
MPLIYKLKGVLIDSADQVINNKFERWEKDRKRDEE